MIRAGLRMVLEHAEGIELVAEAADGAVAARNARALRPDVVLMGARLPRADGIAATRQFAVGGIAVLILTSFDEDETVFAVIRAGAAGLPLKRCGPAELVAGVRGSRRSRR